MSDYPKSYEQRAIDIVATARAESTASSDTAYQEIAIRECAMRLEAEDLLRRVEGVAWLAESKPGLDGEIKEYLRRLRA